MDLKDFKKIGKMLETRGLVSSSHSGNISIRDGNYMYIKKTGKMLGYLKDSDIIRVSLNRPDDPGYEKASIEAIVHRAIYLNTDHKSVIHAHTQFAIIESLVYDKILPADVEGKLYISEIPVIKVKESVGSQELAENLAKVLREFPAAIVKGHGTFAAGMNLEEAYKWITIIESISKINYYFELIKK